MSFKIFRPEKIILVKDHIGGVWSSGQGKRSNYKKWDASHAKCLFEPCPAPVFVTQECTKYTIERFPTEIVSFFISLRFCLHKNCFRTIQNEKLVEGVLEIIRKLSSGFSEKIIWVKDHFGEIWSWLHFRAKRSFWWKIILVWNYCTLSERSY